jgi:hypothetical protein
MKKKKTKTLPLRKNRLNNTFDMMFSYYSKAIEDAIDDLNGWTYEMDLDLMNFINTYIQSDPVILSLEEFEVLTIIKP